ncbi:MAG TPA: SAM-dependent methyltransferase [Actinomycetota bacterium]
MGSGLYAALTEANLLVPHEETDEPGVSDQAYRVIEPRRVPFISYPYEWCFGQLKDAAMATLRIQRIALRHGMSLRDASAYNVQFLDGRPVLIDTLSFERLPENRPWIAYRQFCQHFLAPLALMAFRDVRLAQLLRVHIDGIPLDLTARLLPRRARLRPALFLHIVAHARSQRRHAGEVVTAERGRRFTPRAFVGLIDSLWSAVRRLRWRPGRSVWSQYYEESGSYSPEAFEHKREIVQKLVAETEPADVWDLGGNVGTFARIASERGVPTVCFDADIAAVELNYRREVEARERNLLPLVLDLTNPSPPIGWENRERRSLAERGPADLVLALALIHHLAIGNNVPLPRLATFLEGLCRRLVVEFVPKEDPKVQILLATREDVFPGYTREGFEQAFGKRFEIEARIGIRDSSRIIYLMRRR